ncbi:MAG: TniQ family protein [Clostridia bacterium]|nr:TniQ family protein [Clostridia bacterium]
MGRRFTIRLKPFESESLSSYLYRIAESNGVDVRGITKNIFGKKAEQEITLRNICQLDILPRSLADVKVLSNLLGLEVKCVERHTFTSVIDKLIINESANDKSHRSSLLIKSINTYNRSFCISCLRETGTYNLLWQVNGINICDKHFTRLKSVCPNCNSPIPYCSEFINKHKCPNCGSLYYQYEEEKVADDDIINEQIEVYTNWRFLLDQNCSLVSVKTGFTKQQLLAMKILYASQMSCSEFKQNHNSSLKKSFSIKLMKKANGISDNYNIRLHVLLDFLKNNNLTVEQFADICIPDTYIKSIIESYKSTKSKKPGPCLSPWCKSYKKKITMKVVKGYKFNYEKYELGSVCTKCYMKYGYNRSTGIWESIDNEVDLIWDKVKPLLDKGIPKKIIKRDLDIGLDRVYKYYGYLLHNNLLENSWNDIPEETYEDLVEKFEVIMALPGDTCSNAYKIYGWSKPHYYYYLADERIQKFLIFKSDYLRKKFGSCKPKGILYWKQKVEEAIQQCITSGEDINSHKIRKIIGCTKKTLISYSLDEYITKIQCEHKKEKGNVLRDHLIEITDRYLSAIMLEGKTATLDQIYEMGGVYDKFMRKNYPYIVAEILNKIKLHNGTILKQKYGKEFDAISEAIRTLEENGQAIKYSILSKMTGLSEYVISKRLKMLNQP